MPILIAILGAIAAASIWYWRMQQARDAADVLLNAANDVRLAARRFGFRNKLNVHPADSIQDSRLAAAGIVAAIAEMGGMLNADQTQSMTRQFQTTFNISSDEAAEIAIFGRWISGQCGSRSDAVRRLSKRLVGIAGQSALPDLIAMIEATQTATGHGMGEDEADAVATINRQFGVR